MVKKERMRVCFILERGSPPRLNSIIAETFVLLEKLGAEVKVMYPEEELFRLDALTVDADIYLLKSDSEFALSLAIILENLGARVINSCNACMKAKDKVLAATVLLQAGIPTPRSFAASSPSQLSGSFANRPLILKPHRGYHGVGLSIAEAPSELPSGEAYPDMVFAQEYLADARKDLKVFAIGEEIFGIRKPFSKDSFLKAGELTELPPEVEEIARECGKAFGFELYGLDIAEDGDMHYVVDVNYFPGYRGVPDAAQRLTNYIINFAR